MPILCDQCGDESPDSAEFCGQCGALLEWHGSKVTRTESEPTPVRPGQAKKQSREQVHSLITALSEQRLNVNAGERASVAVTVRNQGTIVEEVLLELTGLPEGWWSFEPGRLALMPGTETSAVLRLHPPRSPSAAAGDYAISAAAVSGIDSSVRADASAVVTVLPFVELMASVTPENSVGRLGARHQIRIESASNVGVVAQLAASDKDDRLRLGLSTHQVTLQAGASATAPLRLRLRRLRWFGQPQFHRFSVRVDPDGGTAIERPATFKQLPVLPRWLVPALAVVVAGAVAIGVLGHHKHSKDTVGLISGNGGTSVTQPAGGHGGTTTPVTTRTSTPNSGRAGGGVTGATAPTSATTATTATTVPSGLPVPTVVATYPTGMQPWGVSVDPNTGLVWESNYMDGTVGQMNVKTPGTFTNQPLSLGSGSKPKGVLVDPSSQAVYVAALGLNTVVGFCENAPQSPVSIAVGQQPDFLAIDEVHRLLYVGDLATTEISVIALPQPSLPCNPATSLPPASTQPAPFITVPGGHPYGIAVDPSNGEVFVSTFDASWVSDLGVEPGPTPTITTVPVPGAPWGLAIDSGGNLYVSDNNGGKGNSVSVIHGDQVTATIPNVGASPQGLAYDPNTTTMFVANGGGGVTAIDTMKNRIITTLPDQGGPKNVAVDPATNQIFVTNFGGNSVTVISQQPSG